MNARHRENFIAEMAKAGVSVTDSRHILRNAATLERLAEAACNGDWPCDNGEREVKECPECACYFVPSVIAKAGCPDCRATARIKAILAPYGLTGEFAGDPRGAVVSIILPDGRRAVAA